MRRTIGLAVATLSLIALTLQVHTATASGPNISRLRVELSESSGFATLTIPKAWISAYHVDTVSPGGTVSYASDHITLSGSGTLAAVVGLIVEVGDDTSFAVSLAKGQAGTAEAKLTRNNTTPATFDDITDTMTSGGATVYRYESRANLIGEGLTIPRVDSRRLVLSFYYPWYPGGSFDDNRYYDKPTDNWRTDNQPDVSSAVAEAAGAGVDGYIVSWDGTLHAGGFDMVLTAAQSKNFVVAPVVEMLTFKDYSGGLDRSAIEATIRQVLTRSSNSHFLSVGGRPVVFLFGAYQLGQSNWRTTVSNLASSGLHPFFVGETGDDSYGFDGQYLYNPDGQSSSDLSSFYGTQERFLRYPSLLDSSRTQRLWAATASPGQNLSYFDKMHPHNVPRDNGQQYDMTWGAALSSSPEWVLITSWNEFYEATHIEPSQKFGTTALDQTSGWAYGFHNPAAAPSDSGSGSGGGGILKVPHPLGVSPRR